MRIRRPGQVAGAPLSHRYPFSDVRSMSVLNDSVEEAAALIQADWPTIPAVGLVLGSGFRTLSEAMNVELSRDYADIPDFPESTAPGHPGRIICGHLGNVPTAVLNGRAHRYEGFEFRTVTWPVRLLCRLGVRILIVTNASGGINPEYACGDVVVLNDQINLMWGNPLIGPNDETVGPRFLDMSSPYDPKLAAAAISAANRRDIAVQSGVYLAMAGPTYETLAEYRMARTLGADVVGMSTVPEVLVARHAGVRVLGLSVVSNVFRPNSTEPTEGDHVVQTVSKTADSVLRIIQEVVGELNLNSDELTPGRSR